MKIATAKEMKEIDRRTIEEVGIPGVVLMENAGLRVIEALENNFENLEDYRIAIFCGKGNNGGDGFVVARHLINRGCDIRVFLVGEMDKLKGDAKINANILANMDFIIEEIKSEDDLKNIETELLDYHIIIDALFGTGLSKPVSGIYEKVIEIINNSNAFIVAIDIPSGLYADSGTIPGPCIMADLTVTFGLPKICHFTYPAAKYVGEVIIGDISIPNKIIEEMNINLELLDEFCLSPLIIPREKDAHKGKFGHLLVLAGSPGKTGAAAMAAEAAVRIGAGLVTVGVPESLNPILEVKLTEAMTLPLPETNEHTLSLKAFEPIMEFLNKANAIALGPGISTNQETKQLVTKIIQEAKVPMVIDADGINCLVGNLNIFYNNFQSPPPIAITPHPGEMARLLNTTTKDIQNDRLGVVREFVRKYKIYIALKGAYTVIGTPENKFYINPTGNPALACGGSGDILTGLIGGLLACGYSIDTALIMGVFLHGACADFLVNYRSEWFIKPTDLLDVLDLTVNKLFDKNNSNISE